jgi:glycosyltransferase involved in cell wall biosynthesis
MVLTAGAAEFGQRSSRRPPSGLDPPTPLLTRSEYSSDARLALNATGCVVRSSSAGVAGRLIQRELLSVELARWRPDVVYLRQSTVSPSLIALSRLYPTVVELNTLDLAELRHGGRARYLWAKGTRRFVLSGARALVAVSHEIARDRTVANIGRAIRVIPNGVDLRTYDELPAPSNRSPQLVFIGAPGLPWHGTDKIAQMGRHFPEWRFDLIGLTQDNMANPPPNLAFHGVLEPHEYRDVVAQADVAIGSLALHRNGMAEASPLKVAEYLAYGLPVIIGYTDTRFPQGADFLLRLPGREDGVASSFDAIEAFVTSWIGRRVPRHAVASIDAESIEQERLAFLRSIAAREGNHVRYRRTR